MDEAAWADRASEVLRIGGALLDEEALDELLVRVTELARHAVAASEAVSITVVDDGRFRTSNSVGAGAFAVDEAQYVDDGGPCLEAIRTARQFQVDVAAVVDRWPHFARTAREHAFTGTLSTPLRRPSGEVVGALNIYATAGSSFGGAEKRTAELLGEHAAILVGSTLDLLDATQLNEQLRQAVASREVIGMAKGILMERQTCTRASAFDILRRASQRENRKVRDLAEELVERVEWRAAEREVAERAEEGPL